jgi:hypothetical protein
MSAKEWIRTVILSVALSAALLLAVAAVVFAAMKLL